ncbi:activating signal cointegrator 1 complex subunit 2 homolog [Olea europaea var. sylvestris]|uniref:activating signal cointegrator 1 complex subunit 2 homolog n=1 Tax=Olea europaea var. sylvestris TaxID=158386 RepID=UPI000C1CEE69|nr:activating signal cointegrator 1 complex subunit 2 homolog [Olea europaea var. sylvestris]
MSSNEDIPPRRVRENVGMPPPAAAPCSSASTSPPPQKRWHADDHSVVERDGHHGRKHEGHCQPKHGHERTHGPNAEPASPAKSRHRQQQQQQQREPRNRPQPLPPMTHQPKERHKNVPHAVQPRNRHQRKEDEARTQARPSHQPPRYEAEENNDSDEQQRSCDLDNDDENLSFSRELKNAQVSNHYVMPKIPKYDGRSDQEKYLSAYKTHMSLQGANPTVKCRAFHLTLSGAVEIWYSRLPPGSIKNWP